MPYIIHYSTRATKELEGIIQYVISEFGLSTAVKVKVTIAKLFNKFQ